MIIKVLKPERNINKKATQVCTTKIDMRIMWVNLGITKNKSSN